MPGKNGAVGRNRIQAGFEGYRLQAAVLMRDSLHKRVTRRLDGGRVSGNPDSAKEMKV